MLLVATLLFTFLTSASYSQTDNGFISELVSASNNFAFSIYRNLDTKDNILISPAGLSICLSMLFVGSGTNTSAQLEEVLGYNSDVDKAQIAKGYHGILKKLATSSSVAEFKLSNGIYVGDHYQILQNYSEVVKQYYAARIEQADFSSQSLLHKINEWIKTTTGGKMGQILEKPPEAIKGMIMSVAYFNANWLEGFELKNRRRFHGRQKTTLVDMMQSSVKYVRSKQSEELRATVIRIPYEGENVSMVVVLPDSEIPISRVETKLDWQSLKAALNSVRRRSGRLMMPKFELRKQYDVRNKFTLLATVDWSDLSGIAEGNFTLDRIDHQTYIEIKEKRITPTRSTTSRFPISTPRVIEINRPFIFFIYDKPTGLLLFMGRVNNL